jgi:hypothetical protein
MNYEPDIDCRGSILNGKKIYRNQRWTRWYYRGNLSPVRGGLLNMKILSEMLAVGLAVSLNMPRKVEAVPIVIAPLVCAKVCVLLGTTIIGGVTSYVWHNRTAKKKYFADEKGNVRKMIDEPDAFEEEQVINIYGKELTQEQAEERCQRESDMHGLEFVRVEQKSNGSWRCIAK